ncbi:MAG: hypothetical protein JO122_18355 [Acetobacteraceae bacterium]|nr:hypothetical protein [Acetobacteraceae bacterium]
MDVLKRLRVLSASWAFASGNYALMIHVTAIYQTPKWLVDALFCGVLLWEALGAWSYARAASTIAAGVNQRRLAVRAFVINLALWAAFMFADEIFLVYSIENVHRAVFSTQLITLLAICLLPDE